MLTPNIFPTRISLRTGGAPHVQTFGANPAFTGVENTDRAAYFGSTRPQPYEIVNNNGRDPVEFVDGWMDGVDHRWPMVVYSLTNIGYGGFPKGQAMDFQFNVVGSVNPAQTTISTYPGDGQTNVPLSYGGGDGPRNLPGTGPYGYPITLLVDHPEFTPEGPDPEGPTTATLVDSADPTKQLPVFIADPSTGAGSQYNVIPLQPLKPATTYIATVAGTDTKYKFQKTWRFTTVDFNAVFRESGAPLTNGKEYFFSWVMAGAAVPSQLEYGPDTNYGTIVPGTASQNATTPVFTARVPLPLPGAITHWRVTSKDAQGNTLYATVDHFIQNAAATPTPDPAPTPAPSPAPGATAERLSPGGVLLPNNQLLSPNKAYQLLYQPDGNLVLYRVADKFVVWSSNTQGRTPSRLVMQADGNLVMYGIDNNAQWHSSTFGAGNENSSALLQDDGKLVIINSLGQTIWANGAATPIQVTPPARSKLIPGASLLAGQSLNSVNGTYKLTYQTDGNLVVYKDGTALWASNTSGKAPGRVCMQIDGNLVMYGQDGSPQWATATNSAANAYGELVMQTDGNLVIYNPNGAAVWSIR